MKKTSKFLFGLMAFLFVTFPLLAQDVYPDAENMENQRRAIINNAVNMGETLVGIALFLQLAFVIQKVRNGLKESGEIVRWGIGIVVYVIFFEVIIKSFLFNLIGFSG